MSADISLPKTYELSESFFNKYGALSVFLSRFLLLGLGAPVNYLSGFSKYSFRKFLISAIPGELLYAVIYTYIGFAFRESSLSILDVIIDFSLIVILILTGMLALILLKKISKGWKAVSMNVRIILLLMVILVTSAHAQTLNEEQVLLNGYVDNSGKALLTGYATPGSLSFMPFLNGTQYTFDNNTNQLYAVTDALTSKSGDTWSLNFSLDGYYSDYSVTFDLPAGSEVTRIEVPPELNYQLEVKDASLTLSIHGYSVISPWIKVDYKLPAEVPVQSRYPPTSMLLVSLIIALIAGVIFAFYRRRMKRGTVVPEKKESQDKETPVIPETKPEAGEILITGAMQKVIDTLSDKEKVIISLLIRNGGSATQADIRYETGIPKSSLTGILNALKRRNIIKKHENGRTNVIELSKWFVSEKEPK